MMVSKQANVTFRTAIQYSPRSRGLRLALVYVRVRRKLQRGTYDLYGILTGYSGGGCYADDLFHVEERCGIFTTYSSSDGFLWGIDRIGVSGLEGTRLTNTVESLLESIRDSMSRRWLEWTDDGLPDLQIAAKRRLNCWRRRVLWLSPGFDYELLRFMSQRWPVSVDFSERAEEFQRFHERHLAQRRGWQRGIEKVINDYPEIVELGLTLIGRESIGKRVALLFADRFQRRVLVEPKWGEPTLTEVKNLVSYRNTLSASAKAQTRLIAVGTRVTPEVRRSLNEHGIQWTQIDYENLMSYLQKRGDESLAAVFDRRTSKW